MDNLQSTLGKHKVVGVEVKVVVAFESNGDVMALAQSVRVGEPAPIEE